jgi:DNA-binding transcriptional LysR family regulator
MQIVDALRNSQTDVGITRGPFSDHDLQSHLLFREQLVVALPNGHKLAKQTSVKLRYFAGERFIMFPCEEVPSLYYHLINLCETAGFTPNIVQEPLSIMTMIGLVASGVGIAVLPLSTACAWLPNVVYRQLSDAQATTDFMLLLRGRDHLPHLDRFIFVAKKTTEQQRTLSQ